MGKHLNEQHCELLGNLKAHKSHSHRRQDVDIFWVIARSFWRVELAGLRLVEIRTQHSNRI